VRETVYVILIKRPVDTQAWPAVYRSYERASLAYGRVSQVMAVEIYEEVPVGA
jgi:hypothetical protein